MTVDISSAVCIHSKKISGIFMFGHEKLTLVLDAQFPFSSCHKSILGFKIANPSLKNGFIPRFLIKTRTIFSSPRFRQNNELAIQVIHGRQNPASAKIFWNEFRLLRIQKFAKKMNFFKMNWKFNFKVSHLH